MDTKNVMDFFNKINSACEKYFYEKVKPALMSEDDKLELSYSGFGFDNSDSSISISYWSHHVNVYDGEQNELFITVKDLVEYINKN